MNAGTKSVALSSLSYSWQRLGYTIAFLPGVPGYLGRGFHEAHRIEIYVDRMEQLFNSMDPSPFHEKDLDHDAEEFIVSWAQEYHLRDPLLRRIHVNQTPTEPDAADLVEKAVHNYFSYRTNLSRLELKRLLKQGRISLVIGLLFLGGCLVLSDLLAQNEHGTLFNLARESLTIAG